MHRHMPRRPGSNAQRAPAAMPLTPLRSSSPVAHSRMRSPTLSNRLGSFRRVEQHIRVEEHHGCRVIRRSCSHERVVFSGARAIASRQASRLAPRTSSGRCRRTRTNRSSPWRWMSKTSPGLAPGMTTRLLMSARTDFMGGKFPLVITSVNGPDCPMALVASAGRRPCEAEPVGHVPAYGRWDRPAKLRVRSPATMDSARVGRGGRRRGR